MEITIVNCTTKAQLLDIHIDFAHVQSSCNHRALIAKCYATVVDPGRDISTFHFNAVLNLKNTLLCNFWQTYLTLPMLRLLLSKAQERKDSLKPPKPCHVGIHWIALTEHSQMSTHMAGFQSVFRFLHHFIFAKLPTSSIRVNKMVIKFEGSKIKKNGDTLPRSVLIFNPYFGKLMVPES